MYSLYLGLVPPPAAPAVWDRMAAYTAPNMSSYGDYGAFAVQFSLSDFDLFPGSGGGDVEANGGGDDGGAMLRFLTKCDGDSWCAEFAAYNATMTGEAFNNGVGTRSHPWGAAAVPAVVQGVVGVRRQAPGYAAFDVKPRLGSGAHGGATLSRVSLVLPTLMGYIRVNVTAAGTA